MASVESTVLTVRFRPLNEIFSSAALLSKCVSNWDKVCSTRTASLCLSLYLFKPVNPADARKKLGPALTGTEYLRVQFARANHRRPTSLPSASSQCSNSIANWILILIFLSHHHHQPPITQFEKKKFNLLGPMALTPFLDENLKSLNYFDFVC